MSLCCHCINDAAALNITVTNRDKKYENENKQIGRFWAFSGK